MRRLVCVIEGHGELEAVPVLCNRVMRSLLQVDDWFVDEEPVRQPRSKLVDQSAPSPRRGVHPLGMNRALALAAARTPTPAGILVLRDADDDCPAAWGPAVPLTVERGGASVGVHAVMASREFESWLLWGFPAGDRDRVKASDPERSPRDAKKALQRLVAGYTPTTHQLAETRRMNLAAAWAASDSFDKLVRSVAALIGKRPPERPTR